MEDKKILSPHSLMLENRQGGRITGVKDVKSFDEKEILLFTQAGKLVIKGEQLHVKQLDLEKGEVDLEGKWTVLPICQRIQITGRNLFSKGCFGKR